MEAGLNRHGIKAFAQRLIQTPSLSMEEEAISQVIRSEMEALGFDEVYVDTLHNVVGRIRGSGAGPTLMFNGHTDHAALGNMSEPFSGKEIDGGPFGHDGPVIYGRGASDMKGAIAAMVHAGGMVKNSGITLSGDLLVTCVAREEIGRGEGMRHLLENGMRADFAVSGEATGLKVYIGHRGKFEAKVIVRGRTSHGGYPQGGINAIYKMNGFLAAMQEDYPLPDHSFLGKATVTPLDISASPGALTPIVPDRCEAVIDRRFLPEENEAQLLAGFRSIFKQIREEDPDFDAEVEPLKWFPAMLTDPNEPVVLAMLEARKKIIGDTGDLGSWYFGVDGTFLNQAGIPCVGFGPGNEYLAHTPKDVVPVQDLFDAASTYATLAVDLCG